MKKFLKITDVLIYSLIPMTLGILNIIIFYNLNNTIKLLASEYNEILNISTINIILLTISCLLFLISFLLLLFNFFENSAKIKIGVASTLFIASGVIMLMVVIIGAAIILGGIGKDFSTVAITSVSGEVGIITQLLLMSPTILTIIQSLFPLLLSKRILKNELIERDKSNEEIKEEQKEEDNQNQSSIANEIKNEIAKLKEEIELEELKNEYTSLTKKLLKTKNADDKKSQD